MKEEKELIGKVDKKLKKERRIMRGRGKKVIKRIED